MGFSKIYFILTTVLLEERDEKLPSEDLVSEGRTGEEETQVSNEDSVRAYAYISAQNILFNNAKRMKEIFLEILKVKYLCKDKK